MGQLIVALILLVIFCIAWAGYKLFTWLGKFKGWK